MDSPYKSSLFTRLACLFSFGQMRVIYLAQFSKFPNNWIFCHNFLFTCVIVPVGCWTSYANKKKTKNEILVAATYFGSSLDEASLRAQLCHPQVFAVAHKLRWMNLIATTHKSKALQLSFRRNRSAWAWRRAIY